MKYSVAQASRIGGRKSNQDRVGYVHSGNALLMVVADGMGGHQRGEVAAELTVQVFTKAFENQAAKGFPDPHAFLSKSASDAHLAIMDYAQQHEMKEPPGTTCVACMTLDGVAYWMHAGDSRLYHFRNSKLLQKTRDHSLVEKMVEQGTLAPEDTAKHPSKNIIYNCLGAVGVPRIDLSEKTPLQAGDTLLLCSDGLWGPLTDREIAVGSNGDTPEACMTQLMNLAEKRAGRSSDNLSAILVQYSSENSVERTHPSGLSSK